MSRIKWLSTAKWQVEELVIRRDVIFNQMDFGLSSEETTDVFDMIEVNTQHEMQGNESDDTPEDGGD